MRFALTAATIGATVFVAASPVRANGRFPASNQLVFSAGDPNVVVLRTTFGLLISRDGGADWSWLCEDVLGISSTTREDPSLALTAAGSLVAGVSTGVYVSADTGCGWAVAGGALKNRFVTDLALVPSSPHALVALTSMATADAGADGGLGYAQQVYLSNDDGADWTALGSPLDPSAVATTIDVAASDSRRLYVSAARSATSTASLFVSKDAGTTWTERPIPINPGTEANAYIGAVDPANADIVYIRTAGSTSRLLMTPDAGLTFTAPLSLEGQMLGFALSPDGSKIYAGNQEQGLFVGTRDSLSFRNVSMTPIQCLATQGANLWACSDEQKGGFITGESPDDGVTFTPRAHLVAQPLLACAANASATTQCSGDPLQAFCNLLPGCADDAGAATPDAGAPSTSAHASGCAVTRRGAGPLGIVALLAWIALYRMRSRRRGDA